MKKNFIYFIFASALLLSACSTDLDVTGDWKETMVIYGLLDQSKDTQFIKINKAFLGQGDATQYAQIKDSVQFATPLSVTLQRVQTNGTPIGTAITAMPYSGAAKDPGTFYSADQTNAIYYVPTPPGTLLQASQYKLTATNNETGNQATAQTPLVYDFNITKPSGGTTFYFVNPASPNWPFVVEWNSSNNGRLYQLTIRLNYRDSSATTGIVSSSKKLDWAFSPQKTERLSGGEVMTVSFPGQNFLKYIASQIQPNSDTYHIAGNVELMVAGAADDLSTFIDVNRPSTGIIQERPEFTNITGGMGIFSSRYNKGSFVRPLDPSSLDSLSGGQYTRCLRFLNVAGTWVNPGGCP